MNLPSLLTPSSPSPLTGAPRPVARGVARPWCLLVLAALGLLAGCAETDTGTSVRVFLVYEDSWRLEAADVLVADKEARAELAREFLVLIPDEMAGDDPVVIEVRGVRGEVPIAHGSAVTLPRKGKTVKATIVLKREQCGAFCKPGDVQCQDNGLSTCGPDEDGCMQWSAPVACTAPTPFCSAGECRDNCVDDCVGMQGKCIDASKQARCGNFDPDMCTDYSAPEACGAGQVCYAGRCAAQCTYSAALAGATLPDTVSPFDPAVAFDALGNAHAVYSVGSSYALRYAQRVGSTWTWTSIGVAGKAPNLAVDAAGGLHLTFSDVSVASRGFRYGYKASATASWVFETLLAAADVGVSSALALDRDRAPHVLYYEPVSGQLRYGRRVAGTWQQEVVQEGDGGERCDLLVDDSLTPHISFYSSVNNIMYGERASDGTWAVELAASPPLNDIPALGKTSIVRDRGGTIHIAYLERYAILFSYYYRLSVVSNNGGWSKTVVDSGGSVDTGASASLAVDPFDGLHVAYQTLATTPALRYATRAPGATTWSLAPQPPATRGYEPSIAIAPTGNLIILSAVRSGGSLVETTRPCVLPTAAPSAR